MDNVYVMKIFSKFSMIFAVLTFLLFYVDKHSDLPTLFIYVCVSAVVSLIVILKNRKHKSAVIFLPLILLPMILVKNIWEACFMIVVIFNAIITVSKNLKIEYKDSSTDLFKGIVLTALIYLISGMSYILSSLTSGGYKKIIFDAVDKDTGLFILIYFIITIIFLRILRFETKSKNQNAFKIINVISYISVAGLMLASFIVNKITGAKVTEILYKFILWHTYLAKSKIVIDYSKRPKYEPGKLIDISFIINFLIKIIKIIIIALVFFCIYILIRTAVRMILRKPASYVSRDGEECIERIEKIKKKRLKKNNLILSITDILKNKSNNERIKIYYEAYMKYCANNNIDINKSDTSVDIQDKSQTLLDKNIVRRLRAIYIKVKYSNFSADSNTCNEVKKMVDTMNIDINNIKHKR